MLPRAVKAQQTDGTRLEIVNQLAQVDPNICDQYELRMLALGTSAPATMDDAVALIEEILRTRAARAKLAALSGGAKQLGLITADESTAEKSADETAEPAEKPADEPAEPADPSRDDAMRAAMAPLLIATRVTAILDARRRQRLAAAPPAMQWLAASAIGIILFALVAGPLAGPTSAPISENAFDRPFTDGDPGSDAVLRSDALSSVAHRISAGLIARAAYHVLLAFVTTVFTVAVLWPAAFTAVAGRQPLSPLLVGLAMVEGGASEGNA